jgi:hypothetical protein
VGDAAKGENADLALGGGGPDADAAEQQTHHGGQTGREAVEHALVDGFPFMLHCRHLAKSTPVLWSCTDLAQGRPRQ